MQKSVAKYLIKPVVYEEFCDSFRKMQCKRMQKALPLQMKVNVTFPLLQNTENPYKTKGNKLFENAELCCKIPYKTNGKWSFLGAKVEKGVENHKKSITYTTFS